MAIIIPGRELDLSICSLCDEDAIGIIMVLVMVRDKFPDKMIETQVEFSVCEQHSLSMPISLEKTMRKAQKKIITF